MSDIPMLKTIPIINNKGGVGKTTTTVNVAAGLAQRGRRVLLVDLDSQGSASLSLGLEHNDLSPSVADVLFEKESIHDVIRSTALDNVDLLPGDLELANSDVRLKQKENGQFRLKEILAKVEDQYQIILIDCAPSTSILSVCALVAADAFIIPVSPAYLSVEGVVSLSKVVRRVRDGIGEAAPILGLALTMVDPEKEKEPESIKDLRSHYGGKVFDTVIRRDDNLEEAPSQDQDIFRYAPESKGAEDYRSLIDEIEGRIHQYGVVYGSLNQTLRANKERAAASV